MRRKLDKEDTDDLRPEYDLTELLKGAIRGKYTDRVPKGSSIVLLENDVAKAFPTAEAVNKALRLVMKWKKRHECEPGMEGEGSDCAG
jgi:hypothetical protein